MARRITQWFLSLQLTLYLVLIFVRGNEDTDDAYKNGRNLVLEYFLPINLPSEVDVPIRREKRDVEGSGGEEESVFSELKEKSVEEAENSTRNTFAKFILQGHSETTLGSVEGSGDIEEVSENNVAAVPVVADSEILTTTTLDEFIITTKSENQSEVITEKSLNNTIMIFDRSEDFNEISTAAAEQTTTVGTESTYTVISKTDTNSLETTTIENLSEENATELVKSRQNEFTIPTTQETTTMKLQPSTTTEQTTTSSEEATTVVLQRVSEVNIHTMEPSSEEMTAPPTTTTTLPEETTTNQSQTLIPVVIPQINTSEEHTQSVTEDSVKPTPKTPVLSTSSVVIPNATEAFPVPVESPTTPQIIVEEIFKETKIDKKLEASPGNILQKENLSLAADPLLIANTRLMDSEENVHLSSSEPKRLGAYIVIGLILLSFSSLVGYITFKKRMNRKRQEFESNQESNDTEKALLSLSDYKDNSELEENHLKNNEITPIVVKSNSQINKFEKNTNFSSPKNLNTLANEKNIEKDNVLKSTAENLTQVIIEDSPKDLEEDKNVPSMEKFIVKTRIDQDSIPKKPIIINRSSTGYLPIPQDNS